MRYKISAGRFFGLVTKHACDRRTDGRTYSYDSQDRASIAASLGKNRSGRVSAHPNTPFTRYSRLSNQHRVNKHPTGCQNGCTTGFTTGCIVYTNIQPVVCKRGLT